VNKTSIEWAKNPDGTQGFTWNPITGCLNHNNGLCKGGGFPCYAYKLANGRLRKRYLSNNNTAVWQEKSLDMGNKF
jgi:protein gp37